MTGKGPTKSITLWKGPPMSGVHWNGAGLSSPKGGFIWHTRQDLVKSHTSTVMDGQLNSLWALLSVFFFYLPFSYITLGHSLILGKCETTKMTI